MASAWSCVTRIVVVPTVRWISRSSICISSRSLASRFESGSSSSSIAADDERAGERDALLLAARHAPGIAIREARSPTSAASRDAPVALGLRDAAHLEPEGDVLGRGHVRKQRVALEHDAETALAPA